MTWKKLEVSLNLKSLFDKYAFTVHNSPFTILSMGMSADYKIAIEEGSNMVRIGSLLFGKRSHHPKRANRDLLYRRFIKFRQRYLGLNENILERLKAIG